MRDFVDSLSEEELLSLRTARTPYNLPLALEHDKYLVFSMLDHKREYLEKLMIIAFTDYLYQAKNEFIPADASSYKSEFDYDFSTEHKQQVLEALENDIDELSDPEEQANQRYTLCIKYGIPTIGDAFEGCTEVDNLMELTDEEEELVRQRVKNKLNIKMTREEYIENISVYISNFLDFVLTDEYATADDIPLKIKDGFHRYYQFHYDEIKEKCDKQIIEPSDIEYSILPMQVFTDLSECDEFVERYKQEFDNVDIDVAKFGMYSIVAPIRANKERVKFYENNPNQLKRMIDNSLRMNELGNKASLLHRMKAGKTATLDDNNELIKHMKLFGGDTTSKSYEELERELKNELKTDSSEIPIHVMKPKIKKDMPVLRGTSKRYMLKI
jgi:hypothetical protein